MRTVSREPDELWNRLYPDPAGYKGERTAVIPDALYERVRKARSEWSEACQAIDTYLGDTPEER